MDGAGTDAHIVRTPPYMSCCFILLCNALHRCRPSVAARGPRELSRPKPPKPYMRESNGAHTRSLERHTLCTQRRDPCVQLAA